jgi:hypothetical protein
MMKYEILVGSTSKLSDCYRKERLGLGTYLPLKLTY